MTDHLDASTPDPSTPNGHRPPPAVDGKAADRLAVAVYVAVVVVALIGQSTAAVYWLGWPLVPSMAAVSVVELAAAASAYRADYRRRLGETAVAARLLSASIAAFMAAVNFFGHWTIGQQVAAYFFAGATVAGYLTYLLHSAARRRDQLRAEGKLKDPGPEYGLWQWLRHPVITRRARNLALRNPSLGLYGSLDRAAAELRRDRRNRALAEALEKRITAAQDENMAEIATTVYDMDEIATRLAAGADYDGLTALIAQDLTPERLAAFTGPKVIDGEVVGEQCPSTEEDDAPSTEHGVDASTLGPANGEVVPFRPPSPRRPRKATTRRAANPSTPPVDELVDALCRVHCQDRPEKVGAPTAMKTLRRLYGSCSVDRARAAKNGHNERHGFSDAGQVEADDDKEGEAA